MTVLAECGRVARTWTAAIGHDWSYASHREDTQGTLQFFLSVGSDGRCESIGHGRHEADVSMMGSC
jgi:hypothetical protein